MSERFQSPEWVISQHNFALDPPAQDILTATLVIEIKDDALDQKRHPWTKEWGFGKAEDLSWDFGEVDADEYGYNVNVDYLTDGEFRVKVGSILGDFTLVKSTLTIEYTAAVPEPLSAFLLATGFIGLGTIRNVRKK